MKDTPGIAGLINVENTVDTKKLLGLMLEGIKHEDFHVLDSYSDPPIGIGRVHLNIEEYCRQPIFSEDKKKCIIMIGHVYSYRNLPHNFSLSVSEKDSEPRNILRLYSRFGLEFINFLNGSFLLVIWDSDIKKLVIANDRYGFFPLYYANFDGIFLFASEVKSILKMKSFPRILDERAVADFFSFGYIFGNKTLFRNAKLLPPACICIADARKNDVAMKRYWDFSYVENSHTCQGDIAKTINLLLKSAISKQVPRKKKFGLGLSGGIDSRTILSEFERDLLDQVFIFTLGMGGGSDQYVAKMICDKLQISHHFCKLTAKNVRNFARRTVYLTDGMWMFHHSPGTYAVNRELKRHFDIVFVGTASEMCRGFYLGEDILSVADDHELVRILSRKTNVLVPYCKQDVFYSPPYRHIAKLSLYDLREEIAKAGNMCIANKTDYFFWQTRVRRFNNIGLVEGRNFFECRAPFFDYDLVDYIQTVPPRFRSSQRVRKQIFSTTYHPELSTIPYGRYLGPRKIPLARHLFPGKFEKKIGSYSMRAWVESARILESITSARFKFINPDPIADVNYWFRTELKDFIESILFDSETLARPYFNHGYIAGLVKAHMTAKKNLADVLGALVTFELWHRMFFDQ